MGFFKRGFGFGEVRNGGLERGWGRVGEELGRGVGEGLERRVGEGFGKGVREGLGRAWLSVLQNARLKTSIKVPSRLDFSKEIAGILAKRKMEWFYYNALLSPCLSRGFCPGGRFLLKHLVAPSFFASRARVRE